MRFFPAIFGLVAALLLCSELNGQSPQDSCSIIAGTIANCETWRSGDFAFTEEISFDSVVHKSSGIQGLVVSHVITRRVAFDFDANKFAVLTFDSRTTSDFTNSDGEPVLVEKLSGWSVSEGIAVRYDNGIVTKHDFHAYDKTELLQKIGFCDMRGFWYRGLWGTKEFSVVQGIMKNYQAAKGFRSRKQAGKTEKLVFDFPIDPKLATISEVFTFDLSSLMIKSRNIEGKSPTGKNIRGMRSSFEWKSIDGIFVPSEVDFSDWSKLRLGEHAHEGFIDRHYEFSWFSLNGELESALFDGSCLKDSNILLEYLKAKPGSR